MQDGTLATENTTFSILPESKHLILCEGSDDEKFLKAYLKTDCFSQYDMSTVQVNQVFGKDNLRPTLRVFTKADGFSRLRSLLIIRDADTNVQGAADSIKSIFSSVGLPVPQVEHQWNDDGVIKTGFLLMPSCDVHSENGTLEDLCWEILTEKHGPLIRNEVEAFLDSLEDSGKRTYSHKSKALIHTYFSATEALIASSIGRASESGTFDWTSPKLTPLRNFIISML